jgi:hypothetical protein
MPGVQRPTTHLLLPRPVESSCTPMATTYSDTPLRRSGDAPRAGRYRMRSRCRCTSDRLREVEGTSPPAQTSVSPMRRRSGVRLTDDGLLTFSLNLTSDGCVDHQEGIADDETHASDSEIWRRSATRVPQVRGGPTGRADKGFEPAAPCPPHKRGGFPCVAG